ncbi:MAG: sugar phosphate isomerase/epimerase [Gemmatimonadetes bacterium]|jgi:sugar phosphate isomerase/epimerase|nr:sugar phosphate isomerase/epimerase [Gemmatimonadota bacterium]MBT6148543.1 sugar phosphate isomerase/epimerase [Gemmatimonadota bacterium]MBT7862360.1 sugar phosphate isomerase/epimerase [Gemmatimonadota bacterium]
MKFGTCNEYFENWEIEDVFKYAADIGYDGVEIAPFTLADSVDDISEARRQQIRAAAESAGVDIIGLHWLLIKPEGLYTNHVDDDIRNRTRDYFQSLVRFCGDLGGKVMIIGSPKQRNVQEGWDYDETWERTKSVFGDCLDLAAENDVTLCIEPLSTQQTNFISTAAEARKMVAEIGHPNFQTMVDVCSGSTEEIAVPQLLRDSGEHLYHVHVNDANLRGPGFGETDFVSIMQTLGQIDYQRYVSVEVFNFEPDPRSIAAASLAYLKGIQAAL